MDSNNIILPLILIGLGLLFYKFFFPILNKNYPRLLIDDQFNKPQAFHESAIPMVGGIVLLLLLIITYLYFLIFKNVVFFQYFSFCSLLFLLGFLDDLKVNIKPKVRLVLMIIFIFALVKYNNFYLEKTGIKFLNDWISSSEIFSLLFIGLCFLFVINGSNLIDGYNGLLGIHSLIILLNLFLINFFSSNFNLANLIFFQIIALITFLSFNFPKAKIFLGDGGSYFLGAFIAITAVETSIANPSISPFYFCILLFYVFFEVFFSFFRKLIKEKKSPIHPDKKHLHMLLYQLLLKHNNDKQKSNYYVSIIINVIYLVLTIPAVIMMQNGMFCKYYSLVFFLIYIFSYKKVHGKI
tara:strand:+ start:1311 stop:2369 length:1059 start_codon:yes stop_codon:yes gene_type:complete